MHICTIALTTPKINPNPTLINPSPMNQTEALKHVHFGSLVGCETSCDHHMTSRDPQLVHSVHRYPLKI